MGKMADWLIEEAYDKIFQGDYDKQIDFNKTCKYCGQDNLAWEEVDEQWKLIDTNGNVHKCERKKSSNDTK